ncbi:MAG: membrane protein insertase YidC [Bacteroidetes bacterium]|nr:membrane protein insertase YidC [Bacteroidota bacterium]
MDKKTSLGVILIGVVMLIWMFYVSSNQQRNQSNDKNNVVKEEKKESDNKKNDIVNINNVEVEDLSVKYGKYFTPFVNGIEKKITIETDFYKAIISNRGGSIVRWYLKKYNKWDKAPVQLIDYDNYELFMRFTTTDAKKIDSRDLFFSLCDKDLNPIDDNYIKLTDKESKEIYFKLDLNNGKSIIKKITFYADKYHIMQDITTSNLDNIIKSGYTLCWDNSLNYQEYNSVDESTNTFALISMNGEIEEFNATDTEIESEKFSGIIDYVAIKTKYFTTAIIPEPWQKFDGTAQLTGHSIPAKKKGNVEKYSMNIQVPYKGGTSTNSFKVFIGPLEYKLVESYGLEGTIDLGWRFLIRPIGEYLMLPMFNMIHRFVPNYGLVIIIFSFIIKILLYPLSISQMRSSSKMQLLAPKMQELREKYKDDLTKQQQETMKLYQEYGISTTGGCLPLLIQMPILFALYRVLNSSIDLRQAGFALWINDLSMPDKIVSWNFSFLGLSHVSGLALAMSLSMFIQQKMTLTDPKQKAMVYMMPIMFLLMFSNLPSGLNLYYFVFNILSILQQIYINKFSKKKVTLEELKRQPKKEGFMQRKMREMQELAEAQGRPLPPELQKKINKANNMNQNNSNNKKYNNNKNKNKNKK